MTALPTSIRTLVQILLVAAIAVLAVMSRPVDAGDGSYPERFQDFDGATALRYSQEAIGRQIGDYAFTTVDGERVTLSDYREMPLLVSMIFTSCSDTCTIATKHLARIVRIMRNTLGEESFRVVLIGFDALRDDPEAMRRYASIQGVLGSPGWDFLSADLQTIEALAADLGFVYFPSPRGFDHLTQVSLIDHDGIIYRQIYGEVFQTPLLGDPMRDLVLGVRSEHTPLEALAQRVRLFCTNYDPSGDRYYFDYSLFIGITAGITVIGSTIIFLLREYLGYRRRLRAG